MQNLWVFFLNVGERVTITTKYVVSNIEIVISVWLLLLLFLMYNEIWKQENKKCFLCGKWTPIKKMIKRPFSDSADEEIGYKALVCENCDFWCEENPRG